MVQHIPAQHPMESFSGSSRRRTEWPLTLLPRHRKRSGCSRLQHWIKHAMATQATTEHVVALEFNKPALDLSNGSLGDSSKECEGVQSTAEVLMETIPGIARPWGTLMPRTVVQVHHMVTLAAPAQTMSRTCPRISPESSVMSFTARTSSS